MILNNVVVLPRQHNCLMWGEMNSVLSQKAALGPISLSSNLISFGNLDKFVDCRDVAKINVSWYWRAMFLVINISRSILLALIYICLHSLAQRFLA